MSRYSRDSDYSFLIFFVWLAGVVGTVAFWGTVFYVAWHFLSKYW
jgi:hypothetical protein